MEFIKTFGLLVVTALAEIVGCYLPYLWSKVCVQPSDLDWLTA